MKSSLFPNLFLCALFCHLIGDWFLQNDWMANNKKNLRSAAGYVHAAFHGVLLLTVFPPVLALATAAAHWFIDTRIPLFWWRRFYRQTTDAKSPVYIPFSMWQDQAAHILSLWIVAWIAVALR